VVFFLIAAFFIYRSFYGMRIVETRSEESLERESSGMSAVGSK
jgi:hypothetical protein